MLGNARRLLVRMSRREVQIKMMYAFLICLMVGVIALVVYFAFFNSSSSSPAEPADDTPSDASQGGRRLALRGVVAAALSSA